MVGATGQLGYRILSISRGGEREDEGELPAEGATVAVYKPRGWRLVQRLGIFLFPLLYLYVMPSVGFYLATPVFIVGLLILLEVRSLTAHFQRGP